MPLANSRSRPLASSSYDCSSCHFYAQGLRASLASGFSVDYRDRCKSSSAAPQAVHTRVAYGVDFLPTRPDSQKKKRLDQTQPAVNKK